MVSIFVNIIMNALLYTQMQPETYLESIDQLRIFNINAVFQRLNV